MQWHLREAGVRCLIAVPNLAEHADGPSIAGSRSACFLPVAPDGPPRITETGLRPADHSGLGRGCG
jgi:hypothetical protein